MEGPTPDVTGMMGSSSQVSVGGDDTTRQIPRWIGRGALVLVFAIMFLGGLYRLLAEVEGKGRVGGMVLLGIGGLGLLWLIARALLSMRR